jgi:sterol desaturase/sphingolipid hydroxylase (fatty acid hydroxylase superfamily)
MGLDLLALDLWIYFWHRANHVIPFLWRFHEVHHLDEALDTSTGFRFHFGEVVISAAVRSGLIWLVSMPLQSVIVFETILAVVTLLQHSNLRIPSRLEQALSKVIVTPRLHWVHHRALRSDTDSNYSSILSIWDILFGSRSATRRFDGMPLGVEGRKEEPLVKLIGHPFWRF